MGVEDDGTVTGARPRHETGVTDTLRVQALVANSTQPPVSTSVDVVELGGREVLVVQARTALGSSAPKKGTRRRAVGGDGRPSCLVPRPRDARARGGSWRGRLGRPPRQRSSLGDSTRWSSNIAAAGDDGGRHRRSRAGNAGRP